MIIENERAYANACMADKSVCEGQDGYFYHQSKDKDHCALSAPIPVTFESALITQGIKIDMDAIRMVENVFGDLSSACRTTWGAGLRSALAKVKRIDLTTGGDPKDGPENEGFRFAFDKAAGALTVKFSPAGIGDLGQHQTLSTWIDHNVH